MVVSANHFNSNVLSSRAACNGMCNSPLFFQYSGSLLSHYIHLTSLSSSGTRTILSCTLKTNTFYAYQQVSVIILHFSVLSVYYFSLFTRIL